MDNAMFGSCNRLNATRLALGFAVGVIATGLAAPPGQAADFKWVKMEHCDMAVSGNIVPGDNAKLAALLKKRPKKKGDNTTQEARLCFNIPGGSFAEALKVAKFMKTKSIGTVIPAGSECLGACAILFMSGNDDVNPEEPNARMLSRKLHINGKLEFHTLGSRFEPGSYTKEALEQSYAQGVAALAELAQLAIVDVGLLVELALLGPDSALAVDSVGKASEYRIVLLGQSKPSGTQESHARTACLNHVSRYDRKTGAFKPPIWSEGCKDGCVTSQRFVDGKDTGTEFSVQFNQAEKIGCIIRFSGAGQISLRRFSDKPDYWSDLDDSELIANDTPIGRLPN